MADPNPPRRESEVRETLEHVQIHIRAGPYRQYYEKMEFHNLTKPCRLNGDHPIQIHKAMVGR
jgi:hypothetical protein